MSEKREYVKCGITFCRVCDVREFVYINKRTGEFSVNHSGMCALTYELIGEL